MKNMEDNVLGNAWVNPRGPVIPRDPSSVCQSELASLRNTLLLVGHVRQEYFAMSSYS